MKKLVSTLLVLVAMAACSKKQDVTPTSQLNSSGPCNVNNPLVDLVWLKDIHTGMLANTSPVAQHIISYEYKGQQVFNVNSCVFCADGMTEVYDCKGNVICRIGGFAGFNDCPDFMDKATNAKVYYKNY